MSMEIFWFIENLRQSSSNIGGIIIRNPCKFLKLDANKVFNVHKITSSTCSYRFLISRISHNINQRERGKNRCETWNSAMFCVFQIRLKDKLTFWNWRTKRKHMEKDKVVRTRYVTIFSSYSSSSVLQITPFTCYWDTTLHQRHIYLYVLFSHFIPRNTLSHR